MTNLTAFNPALGNQIIQYKLVYLKNHIASSCKVKYNLVKGDHIETHEDIHVIKIYITKGWNQVKALILYFSGTGNTKYVANLICDEMKNLNFETEIHSIEDEFTIVSDSYDMLVLGSPKYYEYPPLYFMEYLKRSLPMCKNSIPTMMFCTQVSPLTTDFKGIEKILRRKNHRLIVEKSFPIANNMVIFSSFPPTDLKKVEANIKDMQSQIVPLLSEFSSGIVSKEFPNWFLAVAEQLVARFCTGTFPVFAMKYSTSVQCTGCGLCAKKCPKGNIAMRDGRPVFGKKCMFCMRCINLCPANAILYNDKKCSQYKLITKE